MRVGGKGIRGYTFGAVEEKKKTFPPGRFCRSMLLPLTVWPPYIYVVQYMFSQVYKTVSPSSNSKISIPSGSFINAALVSPRERQNNQIRFKLGLFRNGDHVVRGYFMSGMSLVAKKEKN